MKVDTDRPLTSIKVSLEMLFNHEQELNKGQLGGEMELALVKAEQERVDALGRTGSRTRKTKATEADQSRAGTQRARLRCVSNSRTRTS